MTTTELAPVAAATAAHARRPGLGGALRWELRKLRQQRARAVLLGALLAPVPIVVVLTASRGRRRTPCSAGSPPRTGFALALLILGFAAQWVLPLLTAIVAGDIFASEDQHGTWKTVLTRSTSRGRLFWAKTLTAVGFAPCVLVVLALARSSPACWSSGTSR